jgi:hypothetical protein
MSHLDLGGVSVEKHRTVASKLFKQLLLYLTAFKDNETSLIEVLILYTQGT